MICCPIGLFVKVRPHHVRSSVSSERGGEYRLQACSPCVRLLTGSSTVVPRKRNLFSRPTSMPDVVFSRRLSLGDRAFPVTTVRIWNCLHHSTSRPRHHHNDYILSCFSVVYKYNTNKNLYSAVIRKTESEALVGPLGGKQVSFKFGFKGTVVSRHSDANRKTKF